MKITVVEHSKDVINLTGRNNDLFEVVHADIGRFLQTWNSPFDAYLLDTWAGTSEFIWWEQVVPLRRTIANKWGRQAVVCWAEDMMLSQVRKKLMSPGLTNHWYYQFDGPLDIYDANQFIHRIGLPDWEDKFGDIYDRCVAAVKKQESEYV